VAGAHQRIVRSQSDDLKVIALQINIKRYFCCHALADGAKTHVGPCIPRGNDPSTRPELPFCQRPDCRFIRIRFNWIFAPCLITHPEWMSGARSSQMDFRTRRLWWRSCGLKSSAILSISLQTPTGCSRRSQRSPNNALFQPLSGIKRQMSPSDIVAGGLGGTASIGLDGG